MIERNSVVYLNLSAQVLLDLCDGQRQPDEICRTLADQFGLNPHELCADVASTLGCFAVERLIHLEGSLLDHLSSLFGDQLDIVPVRFGDCTLRVQTTSRHIATELCERYQQLQAPPIERGQITLDVIPISGSEEDFVYIHTGPESIDCAQFSAKGNLDLLKLAIVNPFKWMATDCAWFHAGAIAKEGNSAIVTGFPGSGKSSITVELCQRGWDYLSDEVLPISTKQLQTLPFPITPLPRRYTKDVLPTHRLSEISRRFIELPEERICKRPTSPTAVFLPCYAPSENARLERMDSGIAATELLNNCFSLPLRGTQAIETVTRLVEQVRTFKLFYGDVSTACDQIEQILATDPLLSA